MVNFKRVGSELKRIAIPMLRYQWVVMMPVLLVYLVALIVNRQAVESMANSWQKIMILGLIAAIWVSGITVFMAKTKQQLDSLRAKQSWLIDSVNWNIQRLKAHGLCKLPESGDPTKAIEMPSRWPWGGHHTEYLGHLEAAARKWWILYDPSDPTTAPTNEMVSDWLYSERKISREKARAIASMLRPDGLPTGPRK